jgi:hypothetical protein
VRAVKLPSCNTKKLTGAVYHRGFLRSPLSTVSLKSKRDWSRTMKGGTPAISVP